MISIGGRLPSSRHALGKEPDPWSSGIGVFDMTLLRWQDHYDADAEKYDTPGPVKRYYDTSYQEPSWSNDTLASTFSERRFYDRECGLRLTLIAEYTGECAESTDQGVSNKLTTPEETSMEAQDFNLPVGVIVGAIVGGVLAIALLCGALLLLRRRTQRGARSRRGLPDVRYEHEGIWALSEMGEQPNALMMMDSSVYEVDGNSRASELSSPPYTRAELPGK
jgi:hypothetical protein